MRRRHSTVYIGGFSPIVWVIAAPFLFLLFVAYGLTQLPTIISTIARIGVWGWAIIAGLLVFFVPLFAIPAGSPLWNYVGPVYLLLIAGIFYLLYRVTKAARL